MKVEFNKNPNIGLFCFATDKYCVFNKFGNPKDKSLLRNVLKVRVIDGTALGTSLVGIFMCGNSNGVIISNRLYDEEIEEIKESLNVLILKTTYTAIGNLMLCNDKGCIISKKLSKFTKEIEDFLAVPVKIGDIGGSDLVGSLAVCTNSGCAISKIAKEEEIRVIENVLNVRVMKASVNFGSIWIKSGIVANSNGFLIGKESTGAEMGNVAEALGFLNKEI